MMTIAERYSSFEDHVLPVGASPVQRQEMRRAFYAGVYTGLMATVAAADECGDDEELGQQLLQQLHDECLRFKDAVAAGRA